MIRSISSLLLVVLLSIAIHPAYGCTRAVYIGADGLIITGRTMDWKEEIDPNLWLFPRGMKRDGAVGPNSVQWTSKYGSVVTSAFDITSTDGMNEVGLVANLLWLAESRYPEFGENVQGLTIAAWVQYVLDNFATVDEAVAALRPEPFVIVTADIPGTNRRATLHLAISDPSGDSAIFEYVDGELVIHHGREYQVMTNSPTFDQQLALRAYWEEIGGLTMLPGTNRAADRFVRTSFYIDAIPKSADPRIGVASVFSVIRNVSVPYGIASEDEPNIASTRWRTVSDQKNLRYFYESTLTPNTIWINLEEVDFSAGRPVLKLLLDDDASYAGHALDNFEPSEPFVFAGL